MKYKFTGSLIAEIEPL